MIQLITQHTFIFDKPTNRFTRDNKFICPLNDLYAAQVQQHSTPGRGGRTYSDDYELSVLLNDNQKIVISEPCFGETLEEMERLATIISTFAGIKVERLDYHY